MKLRLVASLGAVAALSAPICHAQSTPPANLIRDIAAGSFTLIVKADGSVVGWGPNGDELAARPNSQARAIPTPMSIDLSGRALQVALGETTAYALLEDGTVVAWSANNEGQLGNGPAGTSGELGIHPKPSITPVRITGLSDFVQIEAGTKHAVALREDGTVTLCQLPQAAAVWPMAFRAPFVTTVWMWGSNTSAHSAPVTAPCHPTIPARANPLGWT